METLYRRVSAVEAECNAQHCTIRCQFTTGNARSKLHDLYPSIHNNMDYVLEAEECADYPSNMHVATL
jgi:hypothetical protein